MRMVQLLVLVCLLLAGVSTPGFAAKKTGEKKFERIVAYVDSIDVKKKTISVTREENGEKRTVTISEKAASKVQVGDRIRIKLKAGTNESAGVLILGPKPTAEDPAAAAADETAEK